jgi:acyl carrier protein
MDTAKALRTFIATKLVTGGRNLEITDDVSLISSGVLDSLGIAQLLTYIAEHLHVRVPDSEVVPENFDTVASLTRLIDRLPRTT